MPKHQIFFDVPIHPNYLHVTPVVLHIQLYLKMYKYIIYLYSTYYTYSLQEEGGVRDNGWYDNIYTTSKCWA